MARRTDAGEWKTGRKRKSNLMMQHWWIVKQNSLGMGQETIYNPNSFKSDMQQKRASK